MKRVIFLFLDGVGLGEDDPAINPLAAGTYPHLAELLEGRPLTASTGRFSARQAELIPVDARLGVPGRPQSATGQAAILTGINAPGRLGEHFGPRPDARVRAILDAGSIFRRLRQAGLAAFFCNAYPHGYFEAVNRGKRLLSAVPYAATVGGLSLQNHGDLVAGRALAADFTNQGWREHLGYTDVPVFTPGEAGRHLWQIAQPYHFVFFEHWQTDLLGHRRHLEEAVADLALFDAFLGGLMEAADLAQTLIIVASDHGNVEDCSHRNHTRNPALTLLLGASRERYAAALQDLTDFVAVIEDFLGVRQSAAR
ncbi:alkaline phosphatase family protein [Litorilinea aerophila]|uniref:alkaline phosphatase family protein n=1 Tax=Litorilinea aerophila TaxID=1204385 RepID=UPI001476BF64|nr:alkaline phosphatase family protein [Litorilinea aerophila]MCC9077880.1 alkaline phosphatase family protein [Litorilinea aerophila]GIV78233.1 MAG: metalloenzyme [Litorilinea sp.]